MASIVFEGVTKRYPDGTEAVTSLDLTVHDGELAILVGPSGCGKSTALRMVAGLEEVSDGRIVLDGDDVTKRSPSDRDIAMVFQNYALYPHMTVAQNMSFALRLNGTSKADTATKVREAATTLGLERLLERKPAQLSGGQRQRVAMGRAIVREPKAFLMDEPLSNLDAKLRVQTRMEIARLQRRLRSTMLYVTHDQVEAMTLGDRVIVMRAGRLQQAGAPGELFNSPANVFVAGFIGSPAMNLVGARIEQDAVVLPFARVPLTRERRAQLDLRDGEPLIAGVRPHAFREVASGAPATSGDSATFTATVEVLEALGAESFAALPIERGVVDDARLDELAGTSEAQHGMLTVRLEAVSPAAVGQPLTLALDGAALHLFSAADGRNLER
ncbi:sn-glycerol-3-phosphate ABC transporter ATP-binding protein UgpC [Conexibacter stalactiti]|uniref:Sn-glycerol-3-phosphate ABC transporter ATP-binding protein UgpC n=1 Tax=Conexibacter stalactiti TaxID=1940611 RepID=A0ABU4HX26_9ACTN|nr:sn-glycerol-3-phosphate ABC transporter ATP-binding protein UgpC [Conexibacter stalactiti]MDW5597876.1 sn-glycerol-3-phosphate ABC transporter ATP-binding protein UgpC [Conexibacter stalactiti]MEC5038518.1 sn-glycerol-3-phosphate ABC transporter ATP-binding protein UgpC [Conexibacter stalactiti]